MLSALRGWLWPSPEPAAERPPLHHFFPADEPRPGDERRWFEGCARAVGLDGGTVAADGGDVWFEPSAVRGPRLPEPGERVRGLARRRDAEHGWLAVHLEPCDDDWEPAVAEAATENRLVGQVRRFDAGVMVLADRDVEYRVHKDCAHVDFEPVEGDWLELESETPIPREVSEEARVQIRPLRRWDLDGEVTLVTHEPPFFGVVDNQVYFLAAAWHLPRLPRRGDRVRCSAVESSQTTPRGVTLNWRAVRVSALEARAWLRPAPAAAPPPSASFAAELLQDKGGVTVAGDGDFGKLECGESRRAALVVRNCSGAVVTLAAARLLADGGGQFAVAPPAAAAVPAGGRATVEVECRARLLGASRALCLLDFGAFQIGRWLSAVVEDPERHRLVAAGPVRRRPRAATAPAAGELDARQGCVVVPGQPAFKPAPFVSARLPPYPLPPRLLAMDGDQLLRQYPCLADQLTPDNYRQRLTLLLFIEEVEMMRHMRQFDMTGVALSRTADCLELAVPGLAESRPSLVVGDKVLLSHPCEESGLKYEGHVHEVRHSSVRLLFHPDFQQRYTGQEYDATFEFSRSQLRQQHRAVETALARLGAGVLFPSRAAARRPQVNFIEEACWSSEPSVCSHTRKVSFDLKGQSAPHDLPRSVTENGVHDSQPVTNGQSDQLQSEVTPCGNNAVNGHPITAPAALSPDADQQPIPDAEPQANGQSASPASDAPPTPAPAPDTPSDSDVSFVSADGGSPDDSVYRTPAGGGRPENGRGAASARRSGRRGRRVAVAERLFRFPAPACARAAAGPAAAAASELCERSAGDLESQEAPSDGAETERKRLISQQRKGQSEVPHDVTRCPETTNETSLSGSAGRDAGSAAPNGAGAGPESSREEPPQPPPPRQERPPAPVASRPAGPRPLTSPLKSAPRSYAAAAGRLRALSAVPSARRTPFFLPPPAAAAAASAAGAERGGVGSFCVPRLAAGGRAEHADVRLLRWFNRGLNERQKSAVRRVLKGMARPLPYIIYGPPGSGKTVTVVECILQTYTMCPNSRLLVAAPSNSAADLIAERLHASGALHRAAMVRLTSFNRSEDSCPEVVQPYVMSGDSLEAAARRRIVVGTAGTLGNLYRLGLRQGHFTHVFVDEAGHLTEPEALVPLGLVSALDGQAVLAGDPQQLGPVLQSRYAAAWGLQTSLLQRLSERQLYGRDAVKFADHGCYNPLLVTKLVNNYRSHRELIAVSSRLFYDSELVSCADTELANRWCRLEFLPRPGFPLLFHGVRGDNVQEGDSPSWFNPTEAFQVIRYLQKLGSAGVAWPEVGVISPYRKQTEKIRQLMDSFSLPAVKVGSVEEFQGQEREVIILTTVRSSTVTLSHDVIYRLGFMQSPRRFNVAITRAKCLLIVVGNPDLLAADEHWRHLVEHAVKNGATIGCDGVL